MAGRPSYDRRTTNLIFQPATLRRAQQQLTKEGPSPIATR
jgi:hypothetical protein